MHSEANLYTFLNTGGEVSQKDSPGWDRWPPEVPFNPSYYMTP